MINNIYYWSGDAMVILLVAVAAIGIILTVTSLKKLRKKSGESFVYFTLSSFLWALHWIWVAYPPPSSILFHSQPGFWEWLVYLFSPALVLVFLTHAAYWYATSGGWPALIRIFLGLTLACLLYMLGQNWPMYLKGALPVIWVYFLWRVEFSMRIKRQLLMLVSKRLL